MNYRRLKLLAEAEIFDISKDMYTLLNIKDKTISKTVDKYAKTKAKKVKI